MKPVDLYLKGLSGNCHSFLQQAVQDNNDDLAGLIIEPIQGEGGDNHFRPQFLQKLRRFCDQEEILLVFDEVQTGIGLTGKFWAFEHFQVEPDILCFGKKTQVCGLMCAFDLPDQTTRDQLLAAVMENGLLLLGCGSSSVRFRPHLNVSSDEIRQGGAHHLRVVKGNGCNRKITPFFDEGGAVVLSKPRPRQEDCVQWIQKESSYQPFF